MFAGAGGVLAPVAMNDSFWAELETEEHSQKQWSAVKGLSIEGIEDQAGRIAKIGAAERRARAQGDGQDEVTARGAVGAGGRVGALPPACHSAMAGMRRGAWLWAASAMDCASMPFTRYRSPMVPV